MPGPSSILAIRPARAATAAAIALAALVAGASPASADERHHVAAGDTVSALALRYGSSVRAIVDANGLDSRATIYVGRTVVIPTASGATAAPKPAAASQPVTHTVVAGDTAWDLARRYGTTVRALIDANGLPANGLIRIGQRLAVPGTAAQATTVARTTATTATTKATVASSTYTVRAGDTLSRIAAKHGTTVAALAKANRIADPSHIVIGQRLTIGGSAAAPTGLVSDTFLGKTYPKDVVAAANVNKATLLAMDIPSRDRMRALVADTARRHGVDPALALAISYQESGFNMRAVSSANAIGVMQVIPTSGEWASQMAGRRLDLLDPEDNVLAGVLILRYLTRSFDRLDHAIGGYYQGAAAVRKHGLYPGTRTYVASVKALMARFD